MEEKSKNKGKENPSGRKGNPRILLPPIEHFQ
jgi:hypothetical protein